MGDEFEQQSNIAVAIFMLREEPIAYEIAKVLAKDGYIGRWFDLVATARALAA